MCLNTTLKKLSCVKTWFHFTKTHFNLICKGITQPCFGLTSGVQKNPVLALIQTISRITETLLKIFKPFDEPNLWLTNFQEGRECVLAVGIFFCCYRLVVSGAFGVFLGGRCFWFGLLGSGFFLGKNCLLSPGFKLTPWESAFGRFFSPNLWVLLAPKQCGNSFRNSGRLEREREKRSARGKKREISQRVSKSQQPFDKRGLSSKLAMKPEARQVSCDLGLCYEHFAQL